MFNLVYVKVLRFLCSLILTKAACINGDMCVRGLFQKAEKSHKNQRKDRFLAESQIPHLLSCRIMAGMINTNTTRLAESPTDQDL